MLSPTHTTHTALSTLIGTPHCPILVDVSIDEDFAIDPFLIPTAFRHSVHHIEELLPFLANQQVVVICQKGMKLSAGAAAVLRTHGVDANNLVGGNIGWRDAGLIRVPGAGFGNLNMVQPSKWVIDQQPNIEQVACCWLIRRFVDTRARFLFVASEDVDAVAARFSATAISHVKNTDQVSIAKSIFERTMSELGLETEPLLEFASIVHGTSTLDQEGDDHCAGLGALLNGLSRMFKDDLQQVEAGMVFFDALYHWILRDKDDATVMRRMNRHREFEHGIGAG